MLSLWSWADPDSCLDAIRRYLCVRNCVCMWCIKPACRANPSLEQWLQTERYSTYIISKNLRHEEHAGQGREELHCCLDWLGFDCWLCCMPACLLFMSSLVTFVSKQKQPEACCCQKANSNVSRACCLFTSSVSHSLQAAKLYSSPTTWLT